MNLGASEDGSVKGDDRTMMFRKLYWVTEQVSDGGASRVTGVYTSNHDLVESGLRSLGASSGFRISLVKLDCKDDVLGTWTLPSTSIGADLKVYIDSGEMSIDEVDGLASAAAQFMS